MRQLRVPQREVPVRVRLGDGAELDGVMYTAVVGPDGAPGRLIDRLNDESESFVAFRADGGAGELLHKRWVVWVVEATEEESAGEAAGDEHAVTLVVADGTRLDGCVRYAMPPERGRVLDFLNAAPRFIAVRGSGGARILVQRSFVMRAADRPPGA